MTIHDAALRADRATRLQVLEDAGYKCQLNYTNCTINATELADVGVLKAACKDCRRQRDNQRAKASRLAGHVMRRNRP